MAPGLLMRRLLVSHHPADFLAEHTLDFVLHRFSAGFAEMRPYKVGGFADFLYHRGRGKVMPAVALGSLFAIGGSFQSIKFFKRASLSCAVALRKFSPEKRIGAHISNRRS